jgi:Tat protein secretion system quality control protein TatD with DNase activity
MFETDAPDQAPYPDFKAINKPINLIKIIECYAQITHQSLEAVKTKSSALTSQFFKGL